MDTPVEVASGLLYGLAEDVEVGSWPVVDEGSVDGTVGALVRVGLLSSEEGEAWRALLFRAGEERRRSGRVPSAAVRMPSVVDAASREQAARVLGELLDRVPLVPPDQVAGFGRNFITFSANWEREELFARARFEGALEALSEIGAVEPDEWRARLRDHSPTVPQWWEQAEWPRPCTPTGGEQELLGVIAGSLDLLEGWRVLYGLRFTDGISFVCAPELGHPRAAPDGAPIDHREVADAWDFVLRDDLGTDYGGGNAWGDSRGVQGVSFPAPPPEGVPKWVELVSRAGNTIRLPL